MVRVRAVYCFCVLEPSNLSAVNKEVVDSSSHSPLVRLGLFCHLGVVFRC